MALAIVIVANVCIIVVADLLSIGSSGCHSGVGLN